MYKLVKTCYTTGLFLYTFNPFVPSAPFLYPLKTSKNITIFEYFHGVEKGWIGNEWVKVSENQRFSDTFRRYRKKFMSWNRWQEKAYFIQKFETLLRKSIMVIEW